MKKLIVLSILAVALASCSSEDTPTPQKLSQDIQTLPQSTLISVISHDTYKIPHGAQVIEKAGIYKTVDNIYDDRGYKVLIPRNAIVKGTYRNDGKSCTVTWSSIYFNETEYQRNLGSFSLGQQSVPTVCDPLRGVEANGRLIIHLNQPVTSIHPF